MKSNDKHNVAHKYYEILKKHNSEIAHEVIAVAISLNLTYLYLATLKSTKIISIVGIIAILLGTYLVDNLSDPKLGDGYLKLLACVCCVPLVAAGFAITIIMSILDIIKINHLLYQSLPMWCGFIIFIVSIIAQSYSLKAVKHPAIWKILHCSIYLSIIIYLFGLLTFIK